MKFQRHRLQQVFTMLAVPAVAIAAGYSLGFRWARTPSLPPGIYRVTRNPADPLISFCPTGDASTDSVARGYRENGLICPDRHAPLLKPIAARPGDQVIVSKDGVTVNGRLLPNSKPSLLDGQRRPMHIWPVGTYTVQPHTMWVVSTYNRASYDSRYFGPIQTGDFIQYARPVWLFAH